MGVKIGAHVSAAVSLELSFERAKKIGAECTQIFISPPQQWIEIPHPEEEILAYRSKSEELDIKPNFIHAAYLINLATDKPGNLQKSISWLIYSLKIAERLGIEGTIFHIGSCGDREEEECIKQVIESIKEILSKTEDVNLILENSAGSGNLIGDSLSELGTIIKTVNNPKLKVSLDTQHLFASGYDLRTAADVNNLVKEVENTIGLNNLVAVHVNDSKTELGSKKDRHENIGQGFIGIEGFRQLINHPKLSTLPFILEVPGISGSGPDEENIKLLKSLRAEKS